MVVELLDDKKLWDQFVENSPQGSLFHKWDFLKTVERHSKYQFLPYCVYSGEQLRCIFPFFIWRDRLGLTHMHSPPSGTQIWHLGMAFDPSVQALKAIAREKIFRQVTGELCWEIDKIAPNSVSFCTVPNFIDVRFFVWRNFTAHLWFTCAIDLERSVDEIWASFSRRCRQGIKRVSAHSPEIQQTNDVSPMLDIWRERFPQLGRTLVPLLSDSYLKELVAAFPQHVTVYSVTIDGRIAGATACCVLREDRYGYWIGNVNARKDLSTNEFLIWQVIQHAKSEGFKKLDLGAPNERISEFKSKFDPVLEPYCYVEKSDALGKIARFAYPRLAYSRLRVKQIVLRRSKHESSSSRARPAITEAVNAGANAEPTKP
jgi:hypothetical protein